MRCEKYLTCLLRKGSETSVGSQHKGCEPDFEKNVYFVHNCIFLKGGESTQYLQLMVTIVMVRVVKI